MRVFNLDFALVASLVSLSLATTAARSPYKVKEGIAPPRGWTKYSRPSPDHVITLRIGLPQPNFHVLEQHLYEVSDPAHERYGQHLSKEEVDELVRPHDASLDAVNEWLYGFGVVEDDLERSIANDWVIIKVPVSKAEEMLDTKYYVWKHTEDDEYIIRTTSFSLPSHLHEHIDVVQPTTMFGRLNRQRSTVYSVEPYHAQAQPPVQATSKIITESGLAVDPSCNATITVSCLQQLYNFVGYNASQHSRNSIAATGYLEEYASREDLNAFYADQRPEAQNTSFTLIPVHGGINNESIPGIEANLDVQFAFGVSYPVNATFYTTGGSPPFKPSLRTPTNTNEPYQDWLDFTLKQKNPPLAISTSYGEDEQSVPESYARRVCAGFAQLGARGVSLFVASGDFGVGDGISDPDHQICITNDGRNATRFLPIFPGTCPFVTTVGGTQGISPEIAVRSFFSGGGFSDYFKRPSYQEAHVQKYLKALPNGTYKGLFNPDGRGIPDVSAQSDRFRIWYHGFSIIVGGTSASTPAFAGIVALLNDARLRAHKSPLGFLNPLIYSKGLSGFNDITIGFNDGCGTHGFNASKGWDPVTGLGTPDFGKLKKIVT